MATTPVPSFVTVTVAPGTDAPPGSVTTPTIDPVVVWASPVTPSTIVQTTARVMILDLSIDIPPASIRRISHSGPDSTTMAIMIDRRKFLAAAGAGVSAGKANPKLAVAGGTPVRAKPLKAGFWGPQYYGEEEQQQLKDVLSSRRPFRWYGPGDEPPMKVATFEKEFAARMGTRNALAVTSGTAALQCAMAALQIGPGDEVILPAWTWHSCYNAIVLAGALPVFAEIDESFNIAPSDIQNRITPQTRAILAVHLLGSPSDMDHILAIARKAKVRVIEDCAQSIGASYKGRPVGSMGDINIHSLQINK